MSISTWSKIYACDSLQVILALLLNGLSAPIPPASTITPLTDLNASYKESMLGWMTERTTSNEV